jgi:hypothetical protein
MQNADLPSSVVALIQIAPNPQLQTTWPMRRKRTPDGGNGLPAKMADIWRKRPGGSTDSRWAASIGQQQKEMEMNNPKLPRKLFGAMLAILFFSGCTGSTPTAQTALIVRPAESPSPVGHGEKATIYVKVVNQLDRAVEGASVIVRAGGGMFLDTAAAAYDPAATLQGPFSVTGVTDSDGAFTTWWVCNPCAGSYVLSVEASKTGYTGASGELTVLIR